MDGKEPLLAFYPKKRLRLAGFTNLAISCRIVFVEDALREGGSGR